MIRLDQNIYHAGFIPEAGNANSYFVQHKGISGNWLINAPKPDQELIDELRLLGGVSYIFCTHRDVVSYAGVLAEEFNAIRILHLLEIDAMPDAEIVLGGKDVSGLANDEDWLAIPSPGHTEGHCMLLYAKQFLFSGDSLAVCAGEIQVEAPEWTWQSHAINIESVERLLSFPIGGIFPDHGDSLKFEVCEFRTRLSVAVKQSLLVKVDSSEQVRALEIYIEQLRNSGQKLQLERMLDKLSQLQ